MYPSNVLLLAGLASATAVVTRDTPDYSKLADCPGYKASDIEETPNGLTASLTLAGPACDAYGDDLEDLVLSVTYESGQLPASPMPNT